MPRKTTKKTKHKITPDFILQLYKEAKNMEPAERKKAIAKIKDIVKYMNREITVNIHGD